jgi:hypothetical protein
MSMLSAPGRQIPGNHGLLDVDGIVATVILVRCVLLIWAAIRSVVVSSLARVVPTSHVQP